MLSFNCAIFLRGFNARYLIDYVMLLVKVGHIELLAIASSDSLKTNIEMSMNIDKKIIE